MNTRMDFNEENKRQDSFISHNSFPNKKIKNPLQKEIEYDLRIQEDNISVSSMILNSILRQIISKKQK